MIRTDGEILDGDGDDVRFSQLSSWVKNSQPRSSDPCLHRTCGDIVGIRERPHSSPRITRGERESAELNIPMPSTSGNYSAVREESRTPRRKYQEHQDKT